MPESNTQNVKPPSLEGVLDESGNAVAQESMLMSSRRKKTTLPEDDEYEEPIDASRPASVSSPSISITTDNMADSSPSAKSLAKTRPSYYDMSAYKKRRIVKKSNKSSSRRRDDEVEKILQEDKKLRQHTATSIEDESTQSTVEPEQSKKQEPEPIQPELQQSTPKPIVKPAERPAWMPDEVFQTQQQSLQKSYESSELKRRQEQLGKRRGLEGMYDGSKKVESDVLKNLNQSMKDEMVRDHYNSQAFHSRRQKRTESKIYKLRSFNNCIKYILIHKYGRPQGNVLDLGCGKGGDMAKWESIQTRSYVGIDLSDQSIKEAINRYKKSRYQFEAVFATGDAFNTPVPQILTNFKDEVNLEFDTVSMQFCMHYAFNSEKTVRNMLQNISRSLKVGGIFVGTIPSSDFIKWKIKKLPAGKKKWGNSIYSVEFPEQPPKDGKFVEAFGNVYSYYLVDAVDNVPEFVVPFEKFRGLCEEYNLELRYKKNFFELFNKEIPSFFRRLPTPLLESLRKPDGTYGVTGEDRDACSFYLAFAFEKTGY